MPRQPRIDAPGALHHVIAKGIDGTAIFRDEKDRKSFLKRLDVIFEETGTACYAWALLSNHFHLLLRTGAAPLSRVMRRLMTGHAVSFNLRHSRQGHLFQNRYKSILCQEDAYFLELVRYIHLNPLRAGLVNDMDRLDRYPFSGHAVVMGTATQSWQHVDEVLSCFGKQQGQARMRYRDFIAQGIEQGCRTDLTGGGLVRSHGGWTSVRDLHEAGLRATGDERILGDSDFVERMLTAAEDEFERRHTLKARGITVDTVAEKVAELLAMPVKEVWLPGRYKRTVEARSLVCYVAVREIRVTMRSLARRFGISTAAVSKAVARGRRILEEKEINIDKLIS
ncbi:transposase [Desulfotignum balticum]|jgi:REP element-mobilizing transposase RayT|uniref:transposase n=1 Tax=Desulfotignum balticum TaxID=115781 RepID=UPI0003F6C720|nr:transposase [Desulfotignum balticum]